MPDISTINGIDITTLSSFGGVAFADGQTLDGQNIALGGGDAHKLISTQTASSSSSLSFTSGIDSTYDVYEWHFINVHPSSVNQFTFQVNAVGQTGFNEVVTSNAFQAIGRESGSSSSVTYQSSLDQFSNTGYVKLSSYVGSDSDESVSGVLRLYAPSSTTYVKHFTSVVNDYWYSDASQNVFIAGYIHTTSAIDEIDFKFSGGNIDAGEIRMYGVVTS